MPLGLRPVSILLTIRGCVVTIIAAELETGTGEARSWGCMCIEPKKHFTGLCFLFSPPLPISLLYS